MFFKKQKDLVKLRNRLEKNNVNIEPQKKSEKTSMPLHKEIGYLIAKTLIVMAFVSLLLLVVFGVMRNKDLGMNPSIKHGDVVFYYRLDKEYSAADVVALPYQGKVQIRRVIAVEGDTVDINESGLFVNSRLIQEPEIIGETLAYTEGIKFPITLKEDQIFLLGDNREYSEDSRLYGAVKISDTLGKVILHTRLRNF